MIVPRSSFSSDGRRAFATAVAAPVTRSRLRDPDFVTRSLGDLIDTQRSRAGEHPLWVLGGLHVGSRAVQVVLEPSWLDDERGVTIDAVSTPSSDVDVRLVLANVVAAQDSGSTIVTSWDLKLWMPLPRPMAAAVAPALHRSIDRVVDRVMGRVVLGIENA